MASTIQVQKVSCETKNFTIEWAKTVKELRLVSRDDEGYKILIARYKNNIEETICIHESKSNELVRFLLVAKQQIPSTYYTHDWARNVTKLIWTEVIIMDGVNYHTFVAEYNFVKKENLYIKEGDEQFKSIEPFICRFPVIQEDNCIKLDVSILNYKLNALRVLGTTFVPEGAKINKSTLPRHLTIIKGIDAEALEIVKSWNIKHDDIQIRGVRIEEDVCIVEIGSRRLTELILRNKYPFDHDFRVTLFSFSAC